MKSAHLPLFLLILTFSSSSQAHELNHSINYGKANILHLTFGDDSPFSYESFEIYPPGESTPFQVGRTDKKGRIIFMADRAGDWRIRAFSEDGHGLDITLPIDEGGLVSETGSSIPNRWIRILSGLGILFGIFGVISLFYRKKSK
ncbi:MAG: hypothetical protein KJ970_17480 [Candidatus Eisenbacteria bacterium]|uniref:ABC transporter permease n=1 Tax=Eiseniibacteriota bacterium TaxID=2212470 RepID=A0A948W8H8_UNCEI|nr:hypothetical protein [Candidatus Eisenbacteria bacterium]MBU1947559.1 hypothetical protein [Candidatus Eisenbacteria bacterium]MBU2692711.1 hypothetical protein [Candidatus Eisenbacteria bacterium]